MTEIQRSDIAELHHGMRETPYQANRTLGVLSKMFNLAELWGLRPDGSNPCLHVKRYKEEKRERFLSAEEFTRLCQVLDEIMGDGSETRSAVAAIRLLMLTGCRLSEIQKLRWEHVDLEAGELKLLETKTGAKVVHLGEPAIAVLRSIQRRGDNPWVIAGRKEGSHLTDLQHPWRRIRARAGLDDLRIHDLRHPFASGGLLVGEGLPMIGKLLGHTQVQTTARYAHLANDPVKSAANRISSRIAEVAGRSCIYMSGNCQLKCYRTAGLPRTLGSVPSRPLKYLRAAVRSIAGAASGPNLKSAKSFRRATSPGFRCLS